MNVCIQVSTVTNVHVGSQLFSQNRAGNSIIKQQCTNVYSLPHAAYQVFHSCVQAKTRQKKKTTNRWGQDIDKNQPKWTFWSGLKAVFVTSQQYCNIDVNPYQPICINIRRHQFLGILIWYWPGFAGRLFLSRSSKKGWRRALLADILLLGSYTSIFISRSYLECMLTQWEEGRNRIVPFSFHRLDRRW